MAEIRIERRRGPGLWPWLIGLVVLALLIWAIAELVNTDRDNKTMAAADSANAPEANAAAPGAMAPAGAQPTPAPDDAAPAAEQPGVGSLGALLPLGVQDAGQTVAAGGTVLSKPAHGGFWLKSDADALLWVRSDLKVKQGQQVPEVVGTLERAQPGDASTRLSDLDVGDESTNAQDAQPTTDLYLDTTVGNPAAVAAPDSTATHGRGKGHPVPTHGRRRR